MNSRLTSGLCLHHSPASGLRREPSSLYTFLVSTRLRSALPRNFPGGSPTLTPDTWRVSAPALDRTRPVHSTALPTFRNLYDITVSTRDELHLGFGLSRSSGERRIPRLAGRKCRISVRVFVVDPWVKRVIVKSRSARNGLALAPGHSNSLSLSQSCDRTEK